MKTKLTVILLSVLPLGALVAQNVASPWSNLTFQVTRESDRATVAISGGETLRSLTLTIDGEKMMVPETELSGVDLPQLNTAQLLFGADWYGPYVEGEDKKPHFIIEMRFGEESEFGILPSVQFLFHSGKFQERIIQRQSTESVWLELRKVPGEAEKQTGTITRSAAKQDR